MPTWNEPRTWTPGLVDEADFIDEIQENMEWLKERVVGVASATTPSTSSSSYATITGLSASVTTTGGKVLLVLRGSFSHAVAADVATFDFFIDGSPLGLDRDYTTTAADRLIPLTLWHLTTLAPTLGAHTYTARWKTVTRTLSLAANTGKLYVMELF